MSSGQPRATSKNISVGRYVMLDQYPYKPFKVTVISSENIGYIWLSDPRPGIRSTRAFTYEQFDAAGYVFAEANLEEPTNANTTTK